MVQALEPSHMENNPKGLLGGTILYLQRMKRLLDNLLDLLSAPAIGEYHSSDKADDGRGYWVWRSLLLPWPSLPP